MWCNVHVRCLFIVHVCIFDIQTWECFGHVAVCRLLCSHSLMARICLLPFPPGIEKANSQASMGLKALLKMCTLVMHHAAGSNKIWPDTVSPVPAFNRKWSFEDRRSYMQLSSWEWLGKLNMGQLTFALLFKHILSLFIITPFLKE